MEVTRGRRLKEGRQRVQEERKKKNKRGKKDRTLEIMMVGRKEGRRDLRAEERDGNMEDVRHIDGVNNEARDKEG